MLPFSQEKTVVNPTQRRIHEAPGSLRLYEVLSHPSHLSLQRAQVQMGDKDKGAPRVTDEEMETSESKGV